MLEFQNKLVYSMCPRPSTTSNNPGESNGQGRVLNFVCLLVPKLRRLRFFFMASTLTIRICPGGPVFAQKDP